MKLPFSTAAAGLAMLLSVFLVGQARAQSDTLSVSAAGHATSTLTVDEKFVETTGASPGFDALPGTFTLSGKVLFWIAPSGSSDIGISDIFSATTTPGPGGTTNVHISLASDTDGLVLDPFGGTPVIRPEPTGVTDITSDLFTAYPAGFSVMASSDEVVPEPGSLTLFLPGLLGLALLKRRRMRRSV